MSYTSMVTLRDLCDDDASLLVKYLNDAEVNRYLSSKIPTPYTFSDATWWIGIGSKDNAIVKAIEFKGSFCGVIGAYTQAFEYAHSAEVGYWIAKPYWRKGIATEALQLFTADIFNQTSISRLFNPVSAPNITSMRVLEKAGYQLEGVLRRSVCKAGDCYDEHVFARLKPNEDE
ncbi:GNAT family N-acetyltransferase [Pseudoalteromonas sp. MSK9-3]|uniref:GNAT family N-acetyltransferase n=1 Tax=Pseudoalteromonas sp. MSK9-3 TaxID=1897633 RepID=UPI0021758558|nr:GNAT family protein [Pseudoalteromonas sp. MSK9-3]